MAIERLKFRCYRCNQLLSVSPARAGSVVSCPKCQADLLIPAGETQPAGEPEVRTRGQGVSRSKAETDTRQKGEVEARNLGEAEARTKPQAEPAASVEASWAVTSSQSPAKPGSVYAIPEEFAGMIPPDLADLRPEDLRVEAEFFESLTRVPPRTTNVEPAPWPPSEPVTPAFSHEMLIPPTFSRAPLEASSTQGAAETPAALVETIEVVPRQAETPPSPALAGSAAPPIEIEPPSILPAGTELRRVAEVILPASVVLAWSLFVLVGIAMSFVAGLMIGHYLWHSP
jgi:hypothetical protein